MPELIRPNALEKGDTICIVPTARAITEKELDDGITLAESWGLNVTLAENVGKKAYQFGGSDQERAKAFIDAWMNPEIRAIWCARGGYGTIRMLQNIHDLNLKTDPKWLVGFSDITALHSYLNNAGLMSIHAQMPFAIGNKSEETKNSICDALFGRSKPIVKAPHHLDQIGETEGVLTGGNLSVLYSLRGTHYDLDVSDKILLLEDLDELLYHVDRMAQNLRAGGWDKKIKGLVVGGMSDMWDKNPDDPFGANAEQIIHKALGRTDIPIAFGFPVGHLNDNRALRFGEKIKLSVNDNGAHLSFNYSS